MTTLLCGLVVFSVYCVWPEPEYGPELVLYLYYIIQEGTLDMNSHRPQVHKNDTGDSKIRKKGEKNKNTKDSPKITIFI